MKRGPDIPKTFQVAPAQTASDLLDAEFYSLKSRIIWLTRIHDKRVKLPLKVTKTSMMLAELNALKSALSDKEEYPARSAKFPESVTESEVMAEIASLKPRVSALEAILDPKIKENEATPIAEKPVEAKKKRKLG